MKKKLLTLAMTATMAVSMLFSAFAETKDTLSSSAPFVNTGDEKLEGNFDVTYTFHTASTLTDNWDTFAIEFYSDAVTAGTTGKGYLTLRGDSHGWWAEGWNEAKDGATAKDVNANWKQEGTAVWDTWKTDVADADVTINAKRDGETLSVEYVIKGTNGTEYKFTNSVENIHGFGDYVYAHLTMAQSAGIDVNLTNVKFVNNASGDASDATTAADEEKTTAAEKTTTKAASDATTAADDSTDGPNVVVIVVIVVVAVVVVAGIVVATKKKN